MIILIVCTHYTGYQYRLRTCTFYWSRERAEEQAKKTAATHFALLPNPECFTTEVINETA